MPEWRTRGVCRTPESSRNFGYVMGLTGLGLIIFYFFIVRKQFSENFSNLTTLDTISMLLPLPYWVACIIWLLGIYQEKPKWRVGAIVCFALVTVFSIAISVFATLKEYEDKGGNMLLILYAGFSLCSGIISHREIKKLE